MKKKNRPTIKEKLDDFQKKKKNAIRQTVHCFWRKREIPTLRKILDAIHQNKDLPNLSRTSLHRVLKELHFEYTKRDRNDAFIARDDTVLSHCFHGGT